MKVTLQHNFMRIILSISALIIALSISYYFIIYLPKLNNQQLEIQKQQLNSQNFEKQKECMALGEKDLLRIKNLELAYIITKVICIITILN